VLALAFVAASLAVPKPPPPAPRLEGPKVIKLSQSEVTVNLAGESSKRYLVMSLQAEYFTYDEHYVTARVSGAAGGGTATEDPHYAAMLKHALLGVAATKNREEVTDPVLVEVFLEEVRKVIDPVVFPVVVGHAHTPEETDPDSGLRAGESMAEAKMRGLLYEHVLNIDAARKTLALDDGPTTSFLGNEHDLRVVNSRGEDVYLDVSGLAPDFHGQVHVGVAGRVRKIYRDSFLVQ
jgi:hypothetical protein